MKTLSHKRLLFFERTQSEPLLIEENLGRYPTVFNSFMEQSTAFGGGQFNDAAAVVVKSYRTFLQSPTTYSKKAFPSQRAGDKGIGIRHSSSIVHDVGMVTDHVIHFLL